EDVAHEDAHVRRAGVALAQPRRQTAVDLDQVETPRPRRELVGEGAQSGTDLEHRGAWPQVGRVDDATGHGRVAQEVLAPALLRPEPGGRERGARLPPRTDPPDQATPNGGAASAATVRSSCSPAARRVQPASATMAALSVHRAGRGTTTSTPRSSPSAATRSRKRRFAETPPETTRRSAPVASRP